MQCPTCDAGHTQGAWTSVQDRYSRLMPPNVHIPPIEALRSWSFVTRKNYDKKQVTMRLEEEVIDYFKSMSERAGIPYQSLINLYLKDCVRSRRQLTMAWE